MLIRTYSRRNRGSRSQSVDGSSQESAFDSQELSAYPFHSQESPWSQTEEAVGTLRSSQGIDGAGTGSWKDSQETEYCFKDDEEDDGGDLFSSKANAAAFLMPPPSARTTTFKRKVPGQPKSAPPSPERLQPEDSAGLKRKQVPDVAAPSRKLLRHQLSLPADPASASRGKSLEGVSRDALVKVNGKVTENLELNGRGGSARDVTGSLRGPSSGLTSAAPSAGWLGMQSLAPPPSSTLMEAQESGEMSEHVDEAHFAMDGLRKGQPLRVQRASLATMAQLCSSTERRRLLRTQGLAKPLVEALVGLPTEDPPLALAAAAVLFFLSSDGQEQELLESTPCIQFLLKLLGPTLQPQPQLQQQQRRQPALDKASRPGGGLARADKPGELVAARIRALFSSARQPEGGSAGTSSGYGHGVGEVVIAGQDVTATWLALLTFEKACASAVFLQDGPLGGGGGGREKAGLHFKEKLRQLGGLDTVCNLAISCSATLQRCTCSGRDDGYGKRRLPADELAAEQEEQEAYTGVGMLLRCLRVMENVTFLSDANQKHLMERHWSKGPGGDVPKPFIGMVVESIRSLSALDASCALAGESSVRHLDGKPALEAEGVTPGGPAAGGGRGGIFSYSEKMRMGPPGKAAASRDAHASGKSAALLQHGGPTSSACGAAAEKGMVATGAPKPPRARPGLRAKAGGDRRVSRPDSRAYLLSQGNGLGGSGGGEPQQKKKKKAKDPFAFDDRFALDSEEDEEEDDEDKEEANGHGPSTSQRFSSRGRPPPLLRRSASAPCSPTGGSRRAARGFPSFGDGGAPEDLHVMSEPPLEFHASGAADGRSERKERESHASKLKVEKGGVSSGAAAVKQQGGRLGSGEEEASVEAAHAAREIQEKRLLIGDCLVSAVKVLMNLTNDNPDGCRQVAICDGLGTIASLALARCPLPSLQAPHHASGSFSTGVGSAGAARPVKEEGSEGAAGHSAGGARGNGNDDACDDALHARTRAGDASTCSSILPPRGAGKESGVGENKNSGRESLSGAKREAAAPGGGCQSTSAVDSRDESRTEAKWQLAVVPPPSSSHEGGGKEAREKARAQQQQVVERDRARAQQMAPEDVDLLVVVLGVLVNLVECDDASRRRLATHKCPVPWPAAPRQREGRRQARATGQAQGEGRQGAEAEPAAEEVGLVAFLCALFLAKQGAGDVVMAAEQQLEPEADEEALQAGQREAEDMMVEAYTALLLAFLSTESVGTRQAISQLLPSGNLLALIPVLKHFNAFHQSFNTISLDAQAMVQKLIDICAST